MVSGSSESFIVVGGQIHNLAFDSGSAAGWVVMAAKVMESRRRGIIKYGAI